MHKKPMKRHLPASMAIALGLCLAVFALCATPRIARATPALPDANSSEPTHPTQCKSQVFDLLRPEDLPSNGAIGDLTGLDDPDVALQVQDDTQKYLPLVMIVVGFDDLPYNDSYDWAAPAFSSDTSLSKYYTDMSCGKFTFVPVQETSAFDVDNNTNQYDMENDGVIHVTLDTKKTVAWAIEPFNNTADFEMLNALAAALDAAGNYIDFAAYDSNADGTIQNSELAVAFVIAGRDASTGYSTRAQYLWPHAYSFSKYKEHYLTSPDPPTINGTTVDGYIEIAEDMFLDTVWTQSIMGTLAHELGHYLGLPDLYDTTNSKGSTWQAYTVDHLSLMDSGSYGKDLEGNYRPFSLDMWSRVALGWVSPTVIDNESDPTLIAGSLTNGLAVNDEDQPIPFAIQINTNTPNEFYIIENRRFTSWDEGMGRHDYYESATTPEGEDQGGGLLLWHIQKDTYDTFLGANTVNNPSHNPAVMPIFPEQDGTVWRTIGASVNTKQPFFDANSWGRDVLLPQYGTSLINNPEDRTLASNLVLGLQSGSAPVMKFHVHYLASPLVSWRAPENPQNDWECGSAEYAGACYACWKNVELETDNDLEFQDILQPTATQEGIREYVAHFRTDNLTESVQIAIPPLGEDPVDPIDPSDPDPGIGTETLEQVLKDLGIKITQIVLSTDWNNLKSAAYEELMAALDTAREVLEDNQSSLQDLQSALAKLQEVWDKVQQEGKKTSIRSATISGIKSSYTYNAKAKKPKPKVVLNGKTLTAGTDYTVSYANNKNAGEATVTIKGTGDYKGTIVRNFTIRKATNTFAVTGKTTTVQYAKVRNNDQVLARKKVFTYTNAGQGDKVFAKVSGSESILINKTTGKVTVSKGTKKGTYKIKARVRAKGNANYKGSAKQTVTFNIVVE